jgi:hypothetical protein
MMTAISRVALDSFISFSNSTPLFPGNMTSKITSWGISVRSASKKESPSTKPLTSNPALRNA